MLTRPRRVRRSGECREATSPENGAPHKVPVGRSIAALCLVPPASAAVLTGGRGSGRKSILSHLPDDLVKRLESLERLARKKAAAALHAPKAGRRSEGGARERSGGAAEPSSAPTQVDHRRYSRTTPFTVSAPPASAAVTESGTEQDTGSEVDSSSTDSPEPAPPSAIVDGSGPGAGRDASESSAGAPGDSGDEYVPTWADMRTAAVERLGLLGKDLEEARKQYIPAIPTIPPFIREFNEQIKGGFPSRRRLDIVQEFFKYTEDGGRAFFDELDRDGDGFVTLEDMRAEMRRRNLPAEYAKRFIRRAKRHAKWPLGNSITFDDFKSLMNEREASMLQAFNSLEVSQFGSLKKPQIKLLLEKMQFPATEDNAESMLKFLDADATGFISYGKFRNFLILVPKEKFFGKDLGKVWFESATMVPMIVTGRPSRRMLVLSTLASAAISGTSTLALHPLDTLKTRLQASVGASPLEVLRSVKKLGGKALYRGVIPATAGAASSQGFRVGIFEGARLAMKVVAPGVSDLQVQTIASGVGAVVGTLVRIPCEVLKQRLQAGQHPGVASALAKVLGADGPAGLFRGSVATLSREIPFYVIGMVAYEQLKRQASKQSLRERGRDLAAWETIAVGALSGAIAAALTTPADVLKTRLMTSAVGQKVPPLQVLLAKIAREEGPGALFKGALPRALWIAPLGAMNFAGYELAKNAMSPDAQSE